MEKGPIAGLAQARVELPWWLGVVLAAAAYVVLKWVLPAIAGSSALLKPVAATGQSFAAVVALLFLLHAGWSCVLAYRRRRALDLEMSLATLRALPRERFEHFVTTAFRNEGYAVTRSASRDRGIDLVLARGAEKLLVHCRHWRSARMGAGTLRELYAHLNAERATGCVFVTTGDFSNEAFEFAAGKPVRLIAGRELERMLRTVEHPLASGASASRA